MTRMTFVVFIALGRGAATTFVPLDGTVGDGSTADAASDAAGPDAALDAAVDAAFDAAVTDDGGGIDAGFDGAVEWPEGCGTPEPEWVDLTVGEPGTCDDFTACGGDIVGSWDVRGGCLEVAIMDALSDCPGADVTRREGRGRGCVTFGEDGFATRVADAIVEVDLFVPSSCAAFVSCASIESQIAATGVDVSCPVDDVGNCLCTTRVVSRIDNRDAYRTEGDEIVSTTGGKRWEYCVDGEDLTYVDTSPTGPREPGIVDLRRR